MASQVNQEYTSVNTGKDYANCIAFKRSFDWYSKEFSSRFESSSKEFLLMKLGFYLHAINDQPSILWKSSQYFVTQIESVKNCPFIVKISNSAAQIILDNTFGIRDYEELKLTEITELEGKILTAYNQFLYKSLESLFLTKDKLKNVSNNACKNVYLTFYLYSDDKTQEAGKIIISFPETMVKEPIQVQLPEDTLDIFKYKTSSTRADIFVGRSRISLDELKNLEKEDIIILEKSNIHKMILLGDEEIQFNVEPDPKLVINIDNISGGQPDMNEIDSQKNIWDSLQVELSAEFKKIKISLGELKQITEGLVIDVAPIIQNHISLHVENKELAQGELVIVGDKYGVKITKVFQDTKEEQEIVSQQAAIDQDEEIINQKSEDTNDNENNEFDDSDFDYSDFEIEDDI